VKLYLLRHGIAFPHGTPDYAEDERPLTPEGIDRMKQVARGLARLELNLDRIVTSPLPRALQTAQLAAEAMDRAEALQTSDILLPGRRAESIASWLADQDDAALMLVGHNPALSDLVSLLLVGRVGSLSFELRCAGVAALARDEPGEPYTLDWIARPRLLKRIGR
jgi:phosphohistidine phosphatase